LLFIDTFCLLYIISHTHTHTHTRARARARVYTYKMPDIPNNKSKRENLLLLILFFKIYNCMYTIVLWIFI